MALYDNDERIGAREERALHVAIARYAHRPEVTGIDLGFKLRGGVREEERICLRIHLRDKRPDVPASERIPAEIEGVPTDVIQGVYGDEAPAPARRPGGGRKRRRARGTGTGAAAPGGAPPPAAPAPSAPLPTPAAVLRPGLDLSHAGGPSGTLGMIARDAAGRRFLLSAAHVLAPGTAARPGDPVVQPSRDRGGTVAVAGLNRVSRDVDAACAHLLDPSAATSNAPVGLAQELSGSAFPRLGARLRKVGATTGLTEGIVDGLGVFEGLRFALRIVPVQSTGPQRAISRPGDSGAIWFDPASGAAVGLHCRGTAHPNDAVEVALATSIRHVLERLGVSV